MNVTSRIRIAFCALYVVLSASSRTAAAQTQPPATAFLVTTVAGTAAGNVTAHEILSLVRNGGESRIAVAGADGSIVSLPATFSARGEISANSSDAGVTCYNLAMGVIAHAQDPSTQPASAFVRFGNSIVRIPLVARATQTQGSVRTTALTGTSTGMFTTGNGAVDAGIAVEATVEQVGAHLRSASFNEIHYLGTPDRVVARSTCVLQRATPRATART